MNSSHPELTSKAKYIKKCLYNYYFFFNLSLEIFTNLFYGIKFMQSSFSLLL